MRIICFSLFLMAAIFVSCGDREQMLQALEALEQQNRDYVPFTTDSTALTLTDYFDSHGTPNERMRAHYILGCAYRDLGEAPRAIECYNDAVECADTTAADCDYKTLSRIHGQIAYLFGQITAPELELKQLCMAGKYALLAKDTLAYIDFYQCKYDVYWLLGKRDSLLQICDSAIRMYYSIGNKEHAAMTYGLKADVLILEKRYPEARRCIEIYEKESGLINNDGSVKSGHEMYYDVKGRLLLGENKTDSAKILFTRLLSAKHDINCLEGAYRGLLNVYESKNIIDSISKYSHLYAEINDSSNIIKSSVYIAKMQSMYSYTRMQHEVYQKETEKNRYRMALLIAIFIAILVSVAAFRIVRLRQKKHTEQLQVVNAEYFDALRKYDEAVSLLNQIETSNKEYERIIEGSRRKYEEILARYNIDGDVLENYKVDENMRKTEIVNRFHYLASHGKEPSSMEWRVFTKTFENRMANFATLITSPKYKLSQREKTVCMLIRLSFISPEIIILMGINAQKMTNIRASINQKMFGVNSAKGIERNIRELV